jgi:hypothetical protein
MGIKVPSASDTGAKWKRRVDGATQDYTAGVTDPSVDWATPTKAAEATYKEAVVKAAGEGKFGKGVAAAGNEKWKQKTAAKGPARWSSGVSEAQPDYEKGMGKVLSAISSVTLPPRGPAGDERNYERVKAVGRAVHNATKGS